MLNQFFVTKPGRFSIIALLTMVMLLLGGCGGKSDDKGAFKPNSNAAAVKQDIQPITIEIVDADGYKVTELKQTVLTKLRVKLRDANNQPVIGTIVQFAVDTSLATLGATSTQTNSSGIAEVSIAPAINGTIGASEVFAQSTVNKQAVSGSLSFSVKTPVTAIFTELYTAADLKTSTTTISNGSPVYAAVLLVDNQNIPVKNTVVTYVSNKDLVNMSPASGTALTNDNGIAVITLSPASITASGASVIQVAALVGGKEVSAYTSFTVGNAQVTLGSLVFGKSSLTAFDTTDIKVSLYNGSTLITTPQVVTFSSPCASNGLATLTAQASTINGVATATYRDKGCSSNDTITASVSSIASTSGTLNVAAPITGSLQFISATPTSISLKGMGGAGRQEYSLVEFKVVDTGGNPVAGKTVNFSLNTNIGGIALTTPSGVSDANGKIVTTVNAGVISTPVRVIASTSNGSTTLSTQSDQLTISTGVPEHISLSTTQYNIEGWNYNGITSNLSVYLTDHFSNPVPDGTVVNFRAEGGMIEPSCSTSKGQCQVTFSSAELRPSDGRISVLAYAIGSEAFNDRNGNGMVDDANEMVDTNGDDSDLPEAFVDYNENRVRDANEAFLDFNSDGQYNSRDSKYNGPLCNVSSSNTVCNAQTSKSIHVRDDIVLVMSSSDAIINFSKNGATISGITLPSCTTATGVGAPASLTVTVLDVHGNAMPVGSKIEFSSNSALVVSDKTVIVAGSTMCRTGTDCPSTKAARAEAATFGDYTVSLQTDATYTPAKGAEPATCSNPSNAGYFTVKVTTPRGEVTTQSITVTD